MRRTDVTYGQLDRVLRSLGFSRHLLTDDPPAVRYEHKSGALISVPPYPADDKVLDYHLVVARVTLDNFGIADPTVFASELKNAG